MAAEYLTIDATPRRFVAYVRTDGTTLLRHPADEGWTDLGSVPGHPEHATGVALTGTGTDLHVIIAGADGTVAESVCDAASSPWLPTCTGFADLEPPPGGERPR